MSENPIIKYTAILFLQNEQSKSHTGPYCHSTMPSRTTREASAWVVCRNRWSNSPGPDGKTEMNRKSGGES